MAAVYARGSREEWHVARTTGFGWGMKDFFCSYWQTRRSYLYLALCIFCTVALTISRFVRIVESALSTYRRSPGAELLPVSTNGSQPDLVLGTGSDSQVLRLPVISKASPNRRSHSYLAQSKQPLSQLNSALRAPERGLPKTYIGIFYLRP